MTADEGGPTPPPYLRPPAAAVRRAAESTLDGLDGLGKQLAFYARAGAATGSALRNYRKEVLRLLSEVAFGTGALAVIGGTVVIVCFMTFFTGLEVGQQGYKSLNSLGASVYTGFISAYFNTRVLAPIIAAIALSATVGCGFTAQLGAMRINEEIDALDVIAVRPITFLVTTRLLAGFIAVIPLYILGLLSSYFSTALITTLLFKQSSGTYAHYFDLFLSRSDVLWSFGKVMIFATIIILVHCWYGFSAKGGPAGVGEAVGRAVRTVITAVVAVDLLLDLAIYGSNISVRIAG